VNGSQPTDAYAKAVTNAGAIALPTWNTLRVSGADRASFLHNLCTNHIRDLVPGSGCEAFFTEVKGKVVAHAFVLGGAEEMLLLLSPGQIERLTTHLDRYIIREDVQLVDATAEVEWTLLVGPQAPALLESIVGGAVELPAANWSHRDLPVGSAPTRVVRCALPWCGGLLLASEREQADSCRLALENAGAARCGEGDWQTIRVESFWPLYGIDFDAANLAQECGRDAQAIHLRKGCYLGQETVARIDALGHVNKRLMQIESEEPPPAPGCEVLAGEQAVGRVTSACWSPRRKAPLALAMLRHGVDSREKALTCDGRAATVVDVR
jgi:folate-binding protein YgfZ